MKPQHIRLTFSGVFGAIGAPIEEWSFSLNLDDLYGVDEVPAGHLQALCDAAETGFYEHLRGFWPDDVFFSKVRAASVGDNGHVRRRAGGEYMQFDSFPGVAGTQAAQPMPLQTALVVSLHSAFGGPTGKGRVFLPWPALSLLAGDKRLPVAQAQSTAEHFRDLVQDINAVGHGPVSVVSSKGYANEVTLVRVGRSPDTMRSRRENSPEGYIQVPLA